MRWEPAAGRPASKAKKTGMRRQLGRAARSTLRPGRSSPSASAAIDPACCGSRDSSRPRAPSPAARSSTLAQRPPAGRRRRSGGTSRDLRAIRRSARRTFSASCSASPSSCWIGWGARAPPRLAQVPRAVPRFGIAASARGDACSRAARRRPDRSGLGDLRRLPGRGLGPAALSATGSLIIMVIWFVFSLFFGNIAARVIGGARRRNRRPSCCCAGTTTGRGRDRPPRTCCSRRVSRSLIALAILSATVLVADLMTDAHAETEAPGLLPPPEARDLGQLPALRPAICPECQTPGGRRRAVPGVRAGRAGRDAAAGARAASARLRARAARPS